MPESSASPSVLHPSDAPLPDTTAEPLPLTLMAVAAGALAANIYYLQPLFALVGGDLQRSAADVGTAFTATQAGFAMALLFIVPLVDLIERRALVLSLTAAAAVLVGLMGLTTSLTSLRFVAFALGAASVVPQALVPIAASLVPSTERGRTVGRITGGVLIGILLARTASGTIAAFWGWRAVFLVAAGVVVLLWLLLARTLPKSPAPHATTYAKILGTMPIFFRRYPTLRNAALAGSLTFGAFSLLWTGLALHLADAPFHFGPGTIGLFGLAGASGAVIANVAGRLTDRIDPTRILVFSLVICCASMALALVGGNSAIVLVLVIIGFDIGAQAAHQSNQARIFRLDPAALGRLNGIYMVSYFIGGALGSWTATRLYASSGWNAVALAGLVMTALALVTAMRGLSPQLRGGAPLAPVAAPLHTPEARRS